ncbi:MAG TPA: hypothetical protein VHC90_01860 [Bryobacteraceae bacterium]|nr:hypothetical protein [Bryobacteraceae bacterium]
MNQILHIFGKDVRRLWPQIAAVIALFAGYAFFSTEISLGNSASLLDWSGLPAALVVLACWTLGASVIHEDAPAEESPFWLTRPYERMSLVGAKILFVLAFVFVPLVLAGVVMEMRAGAGVFANAGSLLALCLERSLWLILPALGLGVITRNLLDFAGALLLLWAVLVIPVHGFGTGIILALSNNLVPTVNNASALPMILAGLAVVGLQFAMRRTVRSRAVIIVSVLLSGFLAAKDTVALSWPRARDPGLDTARVRISFDRSGITQMVGRDRFCTMLSLKVEGLPGNILLRSASAAAELSSQWFGYGSAQAQLRETGSGYSEVICPTTIQGAPPYTVRTDVTFAVIETSTLATVPVKRGIFTAGNLGRCEVVEDVNTHLRCTLAEPSSGVITAGLEYPGYLDFAQGYGDIGTFRLSPVLRQKFDGVSFDSPGGWPLDDALKRGDARFVLRKERVVGSMRRTLVYEGLQMYPLLKPVAPPPRPKQ